MIRNRVRRGSAIIDVLVSVVVLGTAGVVLLGLLGQTARTLRNARESDRATARASEQLNWISVQNSETLAAMRGRTTVHGWVFEVTQTGASVFDVAVAESETTRVLLRTTIYRPDSV